MKYILSNYNFDPSWVKEYTDDFLIYDRSESLKWTENMGKNVIDVENKGSDIYDKFSYIIDNYDDLPDVAVYTKANLFKYITPEEFDKVKDNTTFTPLLTQNHPEVFCDAGMIGYRGRPFSYYEDGMYYELNYPHFLKYHKLKDEQYKYFDTYFQHPLLKLLGIDKMEYIPFAPGSNYLLTRENILQNSREFYQELRSYLDWDIYPGESMIIERGLYNIWKPK